VTTTAPSDCPTLTVELCLNGTGALTAASVWTDITTYVEGFGVQGPSRDRDTGRFNGGTTTLLLTNRDRRFDPSYAAGPYVGKLLPRVQGRIRATWSAVTYPVAYFYVDKWPQVLSQGMYHAEVPITGSDGFRLLNSALPDSVWAVTLAALGPSAWYRLGEQSGTTMGDSSGNALHGVYEGGATFNHRTPLLPYATGGGAVEFNGGDMVGIVPAAGLTNAGDYTVCFWVRMPDQLPTERTTLIRQDPGTFPYATGLEDRAWLVELNTTGYLVFLDWIASQAGTATPWSNVAMQPGSTHFVAITHDQPFPYLSTLYIDGVAQTNTGGAAFTFTSNAKGRMLIGGIEGADEHTWTGQLSEVATFASVLTPTNISDLYAAGAAPWDGDASGTRVGQILDAVGWPASLRDLDTGLSAFGPTALEGTALDYLQLAARSEDGLLYMAPDGDLTFVDRTAQRADARFTTSAGTFSDRSGTLLYEDIVTSGWDDESIVNIGRCSRIGGGVQEYRDQTSIDAYGEKAFDDTDLFLATDGEALDRATHRVLLQKDPAFRVESIRLRPRGNTALWPHVLGRAIGDRITIQCTPVAVGTAISVDCHISGISHEITSVYTAADGKTGFDWVTVWQLEPVDPLEASWAVAGSGAAKNQVGTAKASY
jgi:hypothetical protein